MSDLSTYNNKFNANLKSFFLGTLKEDYISLGYPGSLLKKICFTDDEIRISKKTLVAKLKLHKELSFNVLLDLHLSINNPLFVFLYKKGGINIILPFIIKTNIN